MRKLRVILKNPHVKYVYISFFISVGIFFNSQLHSKSTVLPKVDGNCPTSIVLCMYLTVHFTDSTVPHCTLLYISTEQHYTSLYATIQSYWLPLYLFVCHCTGHWSTLYVTIQGTDNPSLRFCTINLIKKIFLKIYSMIFSSIFSFMLIYIALT